MAVLTAWLRVRRLVAKTLPCGALAGTATPRVAPEDEEPPVRDPGPPTRPFTPCHLRVLGAAQGLVTVEWSMEDPSNDAQGDGDAQTGMEPDHSEGSEDREQERAGTENTVRSKTRKLIRKVSKTLSVASTQSGEGAAARRPRYTHCQVKIDGRETAIMRRYPILWHEGTLSHRFSVCVEVGKGDHTVAVRVLRLATSSERASCKEAQGSGSSWSKWSDSLQVNAETPKPHRKSTSQSRPSSSSSGSRRLHPHLPADFYRQKMKDMRAKKLAKKLAKRDGEQWERHSDTRAASDGKRTSQGVQDDGFY